MISRLSILFFTVFLASSSFESRSLENTKQKGVCWVGGRRVVTEKEILEIKTRNVEWISQTPFGWQRSHNQPEISGSWRAESGMWGERDNGLITTTRLAKKHGIKTILKPHIWLRNSREAWRGDIKMSSEEDWKLWFKNYETFMLHYAALAEQEGIEALCIGTELHQTCVDRAEDWRSLITKIKDVYKGQLTYAANFNQEYKDIPFWGELDFIGIQAYFPLAKGENPTLEELKEGWNEPIKELRSFSKKVKRPIVFTEIGYKSTLDAAEEPWSWPQRISEEEREKLYSEDVQAKCYEALFETVWKEEWLQGIYLWKWYPHYSTNPNNAGTWSSRRRNYFNIDFTPQNKQAEKVMTRYFGSD